MTALKLYCTFDDINEYIQKRISEEYKDHVFVPVKVELNERDLSIEMTLVAPTASDIHHSGQGYRYKLESRVD